MPRVETTVEVFYSGAWHDITDDGGVFTRDPITITQGKAELSGGLRPAACSLQVNNADDRWRLSNPLSPYYGLVGLNSQVRVAVNGNVRACCEMTGINPDQTADFRQTPRRGRAWADIDAGGLLARVNGWTEQLKSAMTWNLQTGYPTSLGFWSFEDDAKAVSLSSPMSGIRPAEFSGCTLQGSDGAKGAADSVLTLGTGGAIRGQFASTTVEGFQLIFHAKLPAVPSSASYGNLLRVSLSNGNNIVWQVNNTSFRVVTTDAGGSALSTVEATVGGVAVTNWIRYRLKVTRSGGTVSVEPAWFDETIQTVYGTSGTYSAAAIGFLRTYDINQMAWSDGAGYSHVFAMTDTATDLTTTYDSWASFKGYEGERTCERFERLMRQYSLNYAHVGTSSDSMRMGPQKPATLVELLGEIERTEDGIIHDDNDSVKIVFWLRGTYYNQDSIDIAVTEMPMLPREVNDNQGAGNIVTVKQRDGGEATSRDDTGPMGTADPPTGIGQQRQTVEVNIADQDLLPRLADWWLARGTIAEPRFPDIVLELSVLPAALVTRLLTIQPGSLIELTDFRHYRVLLIVPGWTEVITQTSWRMVLTCTPATIFQVGIYDSADTRLDSFSTTTSTEVQIGATSIVFSTVLPGDRWHTTDTPYDVVFENNGEVATVTAMGASSGTGPYLQTATVIRGVNGLVKRYPAGTPIHVNNPARSAL